MGDSYAVNNASAAKVATDTETAISDLDDVKTSITDPLTDAEGALPAEFAGALAQLKTIREEHERDVKSVTEYANSCVGALRACLTVYENSSAEMVAEQKAREAKVVFEHGTLFTNSESALNEWANENGAKPLNDRLPNNTPNGTSGKGFEYVNNGDGTSTTTSSTASEGGVTTTTKNSTIHGSNGYTEVSTTTTQSTSSMTERLTYETYTGTGHRTSDGSGETSASGTTTTYQSGLHRPQVETTGRTSLPVAR